MTINNLLPGAFDTDRRAAIVAAGAKASGKSAEQVRRDQENRPGRAVRHD